jgi:hypothetical protein
MRRAISLLIVFSLLIQQPLRAEPRIPFNVETSGKRFLTHESLVKIDKGLRWLASQQNADGAFEVGRGYGRNVAIVALAGMAFLSSGSTPNRGPYGANVQRCTNYLLNACRPSGYINVPEGQSHGPMYGHGFATLFLAEVYGMTHQDDVREKLVKAVGLTISSQNREGGWRYENRPTEADISATVCQIMALRAARNCGIFVPKNTVDDCIEYVKRCQNTDGGFRYQLVRRSSSQFARSAAGVVALYSAGVYEGDELTKGIQYLNRHSPRGVPDPHFFYGHYYAVQAMYQAGGNHWNKWFPAIRDQLLEDQGGDGSWSDLTFSREYATAMACVILQIPNNHLPIFKR